MKVILEDDLVDCCKSGDDLTMQQWKPFQKDVRCEVDIVLKANYVQVNNEQSSGMVIDEEVQKEFEDFWERCKSDPFADESHLLLVGDPDTRKSQICSQDYTKICVDHRDWIYECRVTFKPIQSLPKAEGEMHR